MMKYKKDCVDRFDKLVKEGRAEGGYMIGHKEIANKYLEAGIFLYPTQFYEIHCISAVKAQLAGCKLVTSNFAALKETAKYSLLVGTEGEKWGKENTFGDTDIDSYVKIIIKHTGDKDSVTIYEYEGKQKGLTIGGEEQVEWAKETYNWELISKNWLDEL